MQYIIEPPKPKQRSRFRRIILRHMAEVKWGLGLATLSMLGLTLMELLTPWPLKIIFDHILLDEPLADSMILLWPIFVNGKFFAVMALALTISLISVLTGIFSFFQTYLTSRIGYQLVYRVRRELFEHLQQLPLSFHHRSKRGELLTKIASDTSVLREAFTESILDIVNHVLLFVGIFAIMFTLNWQLTLIVLITFPILFFVFQHLQRKVKVAVRKQRKKEGKIVSQLNETLTAIPLVQAFGRERFEAERFEIESAENLSVGIDIARMDAANSQVVDFISAAGLSAVVIFGTWQAIQGHITPGDVLIFTAYVKKIYKPISKLAKLSTKLVKANVSAQRISEILNVEPTIKDKPDAIEVKGLLGDIVFRDVSFRYDNDKDVLKNLNFEVPPGHRVALVGASGSGKSTITNLILRLYEPYAGKILIDGRDIRDYQRESLRREIGLVLQEATLFGISIKENIAYGKPDATDAEVRAAAQQAQAHDFIMALPEGYDTVIGENGATLSGGQRQRIAIARAFLKPAAISILDEPTSALDAESEALIRDTISSLQHDKTTLVITHHLASVRDFDQIFVMKAGEIVERGTHANLLVQQGYYYELYQLQEGEAKAVVDQAQTHQTQ